MGFSNLQAEGRSDLALVLAALNRKIEAIRLSDSAINIALNISPPSCTYGYVLMRRGEMERYFFRNREAAEKHLGEAKDVYKRLGAKFMLGLVEETSQGLEKDKTH